MSDNTIIDRICTGIPQKANAETLLKLYDLICRADRLFHIRSSVFNNRSFEGMFPELSDRAAYIENQNTLEQIPYGSSNMKAAGCGIIAVYNALITLHGKSPVPLPELIRNFEEDGMAGRGRLGTSPKAILRWLNKRRYQTEVFTELSSADPAVKEKGAYILVFYNDARDLRKGLHIVHVSSDRAGLTAHNLNCDGTLFGPAASFSSLVQSIRDGHAKDICLIEIT